MPVIGAQISTPTILLVKWVCLVDDVLRINVQFLHHKAEERLTNPNWIDFLSIDLRRDCMGISQGLSILGIITVIQENKIVLVVVHAVTVYIKVVNPVKSGNSGLFIPKIGIKDRDGFLGFETYSRQAYSAKEEI